MKKIMTRTAVAAMATAFVVSTADARPMLPPTIFTPPHHHHHHKGGGGGSNGMPGGAAYVMGATFCSAGALWLHGLYVSKTQKRELTRREAFGTVANCFLPIVGGFISDAAFNANPQWNRIP